MNGSLTPQHTDLQRKSNANAQAGATKPTQYLLIRNQNGRCSQSKLGSGGKQNLIILTSTAWIGRIRGAETHNHLIKFLDSPARISLVNASFLSFQLMGMSNTEADRVIFGEIL